MSAAYVRFAAEQRPAFQVLVGAGVDKDRHPKVRAAGDAALTVVVAVAADWLAGATPTNNAVPAQAESVATALWATAHGYAALLIEGALTDHGLDEAAAHTQVRQAARALLTGWPAASP